MTQNYVLITNNVISFHYLLETEKIEKIVNTSGQTLKFDYANDRLVKLTDDIGRTVEYTYEGYDNVGNRLEITTQTGSVVTKEKYSYDNKNRLQVLEKDNEKITYLYNNQEGCIGEQ